MGDFSADIHYLMQDQIGKVISEGLAVLYEQNPTHPIDYLAKWFLNYAATQKNRDLAEADEKKRHELVLKYKEHAEIVRKDQEVKKHAQHDADKVEEHYRKEIIHHEYHHELLPQSFPNFIEKQKGFSGVYIGHYDHPRLVINDDQDDEFAHIDTKAPRQINYIGASDSHHFMIGKNLPPADSEIVQTKTVTYEVFKEKEAQPVDPDGNPEPEVEQSILKYYGDVTMEDRIYFFRLPRLGAYLACPLIYQSCLSPEAFDLGLEARKKFFEDKIEFEERKKLKGEERDEKLAELEEGSEEYLRLQEQYNDEIQLMEPPQEPPFSSSKKEYVVCIDTLGQDREISEADRHYVEELVKLFAKSWEEKEKHLLSHDINKQLEFTKDVNYNEIVDEYTKRLDEEVDHKEVPSDADDATREWSYQTARVDFLRELLLHEDNRHRIKNLTHLRVLKFPGIIQNALYLIGYEKDKINLPGTNVLDWKKVKHHIQDKDLFNHLKAYEPFGQKLNAVPTYAYVNRIQARVDALNKDIDEVDRYNLGLGVLLKFLKNVTELRIKDIRLRRAEKARLKEVRNKAIADKAEWESQRADALLEARTKAEEEAAIKQAELDAIKANKAAQGDGDGDGDDQADPDEEDQKVAVEFNEEAFLATWDEDHPMPEIPEEVIDDVDLDLEPEDEPAQ